MNTLKLYGGIAVFAMVASAFSFADRTQNYVPVEARITSVDTDCYVTNGRTRLVHNDTNRLAYIDCDLAPIAAVANDMQKSDVKYRSIVSFNYVSPVDGTSQVGKHTDERAGKDEYRRNGVVTVYAHKTEAARYRWD